MYRESRSPERPSYPADREKLRNMGYFEFRALGPIVPKEDQSGTVRLYIGTATDRGRREPRLAVIVDVDTAASEQVFLGEFPVATVNGFGDGDFEEGSLRLLELFSRINTEDGDPSEFCEAQSIVIEYEK